MFHNAFRGKDAEGVKADDVNPYRSGAADPLPTIKVSGAEQSAALGLPRKPPTPTKHRRSLHD